MLCLEMFTILVLVCDNYPIEPLKSAFLRGHQREHLEESCKPLRLHETSLFPHRKHLQFTVEECRKLCQGL
jgi:hypothetical protein